MATPSPSLSFKYFLCVWILFLFLFLSIGKNFVFVLKGRTHGESFQIELNSLLPSDTCSPSTKEFGNESTLKLVHKHGPCSHLSEKSDAPTPLEVLLHDEARVNSIRQRVSRSVSTSASSMMHSTTLPLEQGLSLGSANYIVQIGLGTPTRNLSLIFDTGSSLTWTQCQPCAGGYIQKEPIFDPSRSSSYLNVSYSNPRCSDLVSTTGYTPRSDSSTCVYESLYADSSYSRGFFATEKLTITQSDVFWDFYFGCGQSSFGSFGKAAGLIGLGRDKMSLVSQTASKYNKLFSYCLPSSASRTGYLTFGSFSQTAKFTPLSFSPEVETDLYGLDITGISVGGLAIPQSFFTVIIDSGTVISRLPPVVYSALRYTFRQGMSNYPTAPEYGILDTCYDLRGYSSVVIPKITISFNGGVDVNIAEEGVIYTDKEIPWTCLAFAATRDASEQAIFGNSQQKTIEVVYDVANKRVGFASGSCS